MELKEEPIINRFPIGSKVHCRSTAPWSVVWTVTGYVHKYGRDMHILESKDPNAFQNRILCDWYVIAFDHYYNVGDLVYVHAEGYRGERDAPIKRQVFKIMAKKPTRDPMRAPFYYSLYNRDGQLVAGQDDDQIMPYDGIAF